MFALIKRQSKEWCLAANLILEESTLWWQYNPMGSITRSETMHITALLHTDYDLVGFVDGSWKLKLGCTLAGIGGFIQKSDGATILTFSGPSEAVNAQEVEWKALCFMLNFFLMSKWASSSLILYTDSSTSTCKFLEQFSAGWRDDTLGITNSSMLEKIRVKNISRELNNRADILAKRGAQKSQMALFWD